MTLTDEQLQRYSRMLALRDFSEEDLESIMRSTVTVVGAGGLGSPVLTLVTALGFGTVRVIDQDLVDLSNLQRQTLYRMGDIGQPKVEAAVETLSKMNPDVHLEPIMASIHHGNAENLLRGSNVVLDGLDTIQARRAVNIATQRLRIPYVYAGAIEYYGNVSTFLPSKTGCLQCLLGDARDDPERTCARVGVTPTLLSVVAAIEVQEAVSIVTSRQPSLAGRLMHIDIRDLSFDSFEISRTDNCPICSDSTEVKPQMSEGLSVTMLCSNSFNITPPQTLALDLEAIGKRLQDRYKVRVSKLFLAVEVEPDVTITVMKKGTAVVKGVTNASRALEIYKTVVEDGVSQPGQ